MRFQARRQQKYTLLERSNPVFLWIAILLPAALLFVTLAVDYIGAFSVVYYSFHGSVCLNGCALVYTLQNTYGIVPVDFVQVSSMGIISSSAASDSLLQAAVLYQEYDEYLSASPLSNQSLCTRGVQSAVDTSPFADAQNFTRQMAFCSELMIFGAPTEANVSAGTIEGINLDVPSRRADARTDLMQIQVDVERAYSSLPDAQVYVEVVHISPLYMAVVTALEGAACIATVFVIVYMKRKLSDSDSGRQCIPEQVLQ
jgi:hypothetical protein